LFPKLKNKAFGEGACPMLTPEERRKLAKELAYLQEVRSWISDSGLAAQIEKKMATIKEQLDDSSSS
jgi:hypothetical protein